MRIDYEEESKKRNSNKKAITFGSLGILLLSLGISPVLGFIDWRLDSLSHFRPHILLIGLIVVIISLLLNYKILFYSGIVVSLISLIILLPMFSYHTKFNDTKAISLGAINVLFNNEQKNELIKDLKNYKFDILILSEINNKWEDSINTHFRDEYSHIIRVDNSGRDDIMLLTNLNVKGYEPFFTKGNQSGLKVDIEIDNKIVTVYGIHPYSPMDNSYWSLRNKFYSDLSREIKNKERVIIAGDFNSSFWSPILKRFIESNNLHISFGLKGTYPSRMGWGGIDIDHIVSTKDINLQNKKYFSITGSDHRGVYSKFSLN